MLRRYALVFGIVACGGAPSSHVTLPTTQAVSPDLHVGDAVVYRFSGAFTRDPVVLREEVLSIESGRVTIDVRATRGREDRRWTQIGPADKDARWNNAVDAIQVGKQRLPNPDNVTLARLYEWVLVPAEGEAANVESARCEQQIGSVPLACTCTRATRGATRMEESRCADFGWQRGPAKWTNGSGAIVWQVEVLESTLKGR